jgi:hypothetical protein
MYALVAGAAAVSLVSLTQPAHAKIVYAPAHHKLPLNKNIFLDLNHDGINDFRFRITSSDDDCSILRRGTCIKTDAANLWIYTQVYIYTICRSFPLGD